MRVKRNEIIAIKSNKGYSVFYCARNKPQVAVFRDGNYPTAKNAEDYAFKNFSKLMK